MHIVADENIPLLDEFFAAFGSIRRLPGRGITAADVRDADLLLVRSVTQVSRALLEGSRVRFVGTCTIGTDHLDLDYFAEAGIAWSSAPGCNARGVVDYVLGSVLTASYRAGLTEVDGVSRGAVNAARETLGGAANTAADLGGSQGAALMEAARSAFTDGMHLTSAIAVVIVLYAAAQAWVLLRGRGNPAVEPPVPETSPDTGETPSGKTGPEQADPKQADPKQTEQAGR